MFVGGGIGITPMRAMFWECIRRRIPVCLLYAVRELQEAAFLEELQQAAAKNDFADFWLTVTAGEQTAVDDSRILRGRPTADMIQKVCPDVREREVFQCGPDAMMRSVLEGLEGLGISSARVHQEAFTF
jgi:ferredoxin-NADP reductase